MRIRVRAVSLCIVIVTFVPLVLAQAAFASARSPSTAAAGGACPLMQVVGVRGSGETQSDYGGYGRTVAAVVSGIEDQVMLNVATDEINYKAIPIGYSGWNHYAANYKASVADGVGKLDSYIRQFIAGPCGATTYIYLIGYSQGAQVVGDTFQNKLTAPQRQRVGGIALLGDPRFKGSQTGGVDVGSYAKNLNGIFDVIGSPRNVLAGQIGKVRSYCALDDPICNFTKTDAVACKSSPARARTCSILIQHIKVSFGRPWRLTISSPVGRSSGRSLRLSGRGTAYSSWDEREVRPA